MGKFIDLTGQRFGRLLVMYQAPHQNGRVAWHCKCDCGNEKDIKSELLRAGKAQSCGCLHKELLAHRSSPNLVGQKFNRLLVLEKTDMRVDEKVIWKCQCDCGNIAYVSTKHLQSGEVKSCGCLRIENQKKFGQLNSKNLIGKRFGKLIVLEDCKNTSNSSGRLWKCQCDCGSICYKRTANLTSGATTSCGCLKSKGEEKVSHILIVNNINFTREKTFEDCISPFSKEKMRFDFYLPDYNLLIEYDGEQHYGYRDDNGWNNKENYEKTLLRDKVKNEWAKNHNYDLIRIPYTKYVTLELKDIIGEENAEKLSH